MLIFVILALLILVFAVIFALQNTVAVSVTFLFWQFHGSLALVLLVALGAGLVISFFAYLPSLVRGQLSTRKLRKHATELEGNLAEHKQRLDEALLKLQGQNISAQPPETGSAPSGESTSKM